MFKDLLENVLPNPSLSLELEVGIVDKNGGPLAYLKDGRLAYHAMIEDLLHQDPRMKGRFSGDLGAWQLEPNTPPCDSAEELKDVWREQHLAMLSSAARHGVKLVATGIHPWARAIKQEVNPAYIKIAKEQLMPRMLTTTISGLHLHSAGAPTPKDVLVALSDKMRRFAWLAVILGANSPFYEGYYTGKMSSRTSVWKVQAPSGLPPIYGNSWNQRQWLQDLFEGEVLDERMKPLYVGRIKEEYETFEVCGSDAVRPREALDTVNFLHCLNLMVSVTDLPPAAEADVFVNWRKCPEGPDAPYKDRSLLPILGLDEESSPTMGQAACRIGNWMAPAVEFWGAEDSVQAVLDRLASECPTSGHRQVAYVESLLGRSLCVGEEVPQSILEPLVAKHMVNEFAAW